MGRIEENQRTFNRHLKMNQITFEKTQSKRAQELRRVVEKELCEMGKLLGVKAINHPKVFQTLGNLDLNQYEAMQTSEMTSLVIELSTI